MTLQNVGKRTYPDKRGSKGDAKFRYKDVEIHLLYTAKVLVDLGSKYEGEIVIRRGGKSKSIRVQGKCED